MKSTQFLQNLCVYASVTAAAIVSAGCDNGSGGGGTSHTSTDTGGGTPLMCPTSYCPYGMGGYAFSYSDSDPPMGKGSSMATLHTDGSLCLDGHVMALPGSPSPTDYMNDWGLGIGINLNQPMGMNTTKSAFTMTGTGVTVNTTGVPTCTTARVVVDQMGTTPEYCAPLTPGKEIPWASFNTACWDGSGTSLAKGAPTSNAVKVQFVTSSTACDFKNFCITELSI